MVYYSVRYVDTKTKENVEKWINNACDAQINDIYI